MEILHHDFMKKLFTSTWCHESLLGFPLRFSNSYFSFRVLVPFFASETLRENGVMQLEFIVVVTIINLLRRLKTSNENHKFSSGIFLLPFDFRLNRNDLFSFDHQSELFSARYFFARFYPPSSLNVEIKIARFKSNIFHFMAQ